MIEYDKDAIVHPYITKYMREEIPPRNEFMRELERYAAENSVPVVQPETAGLLGVLTASKRPRRILEIGCAIGYSAILMAEHLAPNGSITTVECSEEMVTLARRNIERAGLSDSISVVFADAKDILGELDGGFDIIFLDGPKAHYVYMLDDCVRLLNKGGLLIADNVLYKGMTAEHELVIRRKITIVKRLRRFVSTLYKRRDLRTTLIPMGDGVTVSVKV